MQRISSLLIIIFILSGLNSKAQDIPVKILQKTADKFHALKTLSYKIKSIQKNPFSTGDTIRSETQSILVFSDGLISTMNERININNHQTELREVYLNNNLYTINLKDSLYSIDRNPKKVNTDLSSFINLIKYLTNSPAKIVQYQDTTIDRISCYNFFIKTYDTIENNNHNYAYKYLCINKATLMPVYIKDIGAGNAEKGGYSLGRLNFFQESFFSNYRFNETIDPATFHFNKSGFNLENDKMLPNGTFAPTINVKDLTNREVEPSKFKHKILLIEFGSTTCGANPLANPMLNRLNKKYDKTLSIISIYSEENPVEIKKYIKTNKIEFQVYMGNKKIKRDFKTVGTPGFYLIDKSGKIILSNNGYSDELEKDLITQIDKLNQAL